MDFNFDTGTISSISELDPGSNNLVVLGTNGLVVPIGPTLARAPAKGVLRFNTDLNNFEGFDGVVWSNVQVGSSSLTNLSNLTGTGLVVQTSTGVFDARTITGTAGAVIVTNGNGIAGDPTITLATTGTPGTYASVTTDSFGRVTAGSFTQDWSSLVNTPTTIAGYSISDAVKNIGGVGGMQAGPIASLPGSGTAGRIYVSTDTNATFYDTGSEWRLNQPAISGDLTIAAGDTVATLATVNSTVGTFGSTTTIPVVTVNEKGLVTLISTATISGAITLAGDVTGSGTTGGTTTTTLATVNGNVGTFGDSSHVAQVTVNEKGLATAVSNVVITPSAIGAIDVTQLGVANGVATLDSAGKLTTSQIPAALVGALVYQGTWDASTNTPALVSSTGNKGEYYKVSTAGTTTIDGHNTWAVGDIIAFNGTTWDAIDGLTTEVTSVFGRVGAVTATLASADFANQGTATTVLHGNASGNPTWGAVDLSTDVTGVLPDTSSSALTGDITKPAGSSATTLATVNANVGDFGSESQVATFVVNAKGLVTSAANVTIPSAVTITGDATGIGSTSAATAITLATVNSATGTFGSSSAVPIVTVNEKGLITNVTTAAISGAITIGGDASGTGVTGGTTTISLATVNANVGQFGNSANVPQFTVNAKGLVTSVSNVAITATSIGAVINGGNAPSISSGTLAALPVTATTGALYVTSDTNMIYRYSGTSWSQVSESTVLYTENTASPTASTVTGSNAVAIGSGNTASGASTLATGTSAVAANYGAEVRANGSFSSAGDAQTGKYVLRNITTNGAITELFLDGSSARIALPNNSSYAYSALIVARDTLTTGNNGAWKIEGLIKRDATAATTALVGSRSRTVLTRPGGWSADVSADTVNGALVFNVNGQAGSTVRWVCTVTTSEVHN